MKKRGFTLIELLAVIVILAVLALIIMPVVTGIIANASEGANARSVEGHIKNVDYLIMQNTMNDMSGDHSRYDGRGKTEDVLSFDYPVGDNVRCDSYNISDGIVMYATGCTAMDSSWNDIYTFEYGKNAYKDSSIAEGSSNSIGNIVLASFPYLEVGSDGCKTPTEDNYSYMGGCYLRGGAADNYTDVQEFMITNYGVSQEVINQVFVNNTIDETKFEELLLPFISEVIGVSVSNIQAMASSVNKSTAEYICEDMLNMIYPLINEELDNYLWYSGFLWRIMGINSDGSVRMITEENMTAIPYDDDSSAFSGSYAEEWLNNYFYKNLTSNKNRVIVNGTWCADNTYIENKKIARTTCTETISDKVGLISIDEYNLSGFLSSYLVTNHNFRLLTPKDASTSWAVLDYYSLGYINESPIINSYGLRPVVNVNSATIVTSGTGEGSSSPYILSEATNSSSLLKDKAISGEYVKYADKTYRIVSVDNEGNTKLILDDIYKEENAIFSLKYGDNNIFTTSSGVGQKLNNDVLKWLVPSDDTINRNKLVTDYNWYQNEFSNGYNYNISLNETNPTRVVNATVGLIRVGEMLSNVSQSIDGNSTSWALTPYVNTIYAYLINGNSDVWASEVKFVYPLRPVIVVNSSVTISTGVGTLSSPYEI